MSEKLYDCVIIASDDKQRKKVRFANDLAKRVKVLTKAKFEIYFAETVDRKMTKAELIDFVLDHEKLDVNDEDVVLEAKQKLNKSKTEVEDVLDAILLRHKQQQETTAEVAV